MLLDLRGLTMLERLDLRDRALFLRVAIGRPRSRRMRRLWTAASWLGGTTASVLAATVPLGAGGELAAAARQALATLIASHVVVQLVKRTVGRPRPSRGVSCATFAAEPDKFSFPSGHSAAAMAIAFVYATAFPSLAAPLLILAILTGASRVCLAVHYPGDVVMGQLIAITTGVVVRAL